MTRVKYTITCDLYQNLLVCVIFFLKYSPSGAYTTFTQTTLKVSDGSYSCLIEDSHKSDNMRRRKNLQRVSIQKQSCVYSEQSASVTTGSCTKVLLGGKQSLMKTVDKEVCQLSTKRCVAVEFFKCHFVVLLWALPTSRILDSRKLYF